MTRARLDLALSWAAARNPGQAGPPQAVPVPRPAAARVGAAARRAGAQPAGARTCASCGAPAGRRRQGAAAAAPTCPTPYDEALFERLREWRRVRAKADEVAAFMVFSNATLEQIAEDAARRPAGAAARSAASAPTSSTSYGDDLLALVG